MAQYGLVRGMDHHSNELFMCKHMIPDPQLGLTGLMDIDIPFRMHHPSILPGKSLITSANHDMEGIGLILSSGDRTLDNFIRLATTDMKIPLLYNIAQALKFLHYHQILYLNLRPHNVVLLNDRPFLIDFESSILVDDVAVGKETSSFPESEYVAPEIRNSRPTCTAAADVWAYGMLALKILTGQLDLHQPLDDLLSGVRPIYRNRCKNFLYKIIQLEPDQRPTMEDICNDELFRDGRSESVGTILIPNIRSNYAPNHRDIMKLILHWATAVYPTESSELLFLAIDLYNRVGSFIADQTDHVRLEFAAVGLWMASKLLCLTVVPLDEYINKIKDLAGELSADSMIDTEAKIIYFLKGVLNVSSWYNRCSSTHQIKRCFDQIIMNRDSTVYATTDIDAWLEIVDDSSTDKHITIADLVNI